MSPANWTGFESDYPTASERLAIQRALWIDQAGEPARPFAWADAFVGAFAAVSLVGFTQGWTLVGLGALLAALFVRIGGV